MSRPSPIFSLPFRLLVPFSLALGGVILLTNCGEQDQPEAPATDDASEASAPPSATPAPDEPPAPEEPAQPLNPILDVLENEAEKKIVVSGQIASSYQAQDIVEGLRRTFPEVEVVEELTIDARIPGVVWGNRVGDLLLPFIQSIENARFRYEDGVVLLEGTAENAGMVNQVGSLTVNIMEAPDSQGISNKLKVKGKE